MPQIRTQRQSAIGGIDPNNNVSVVLSRREFVISINSGRHEWPIKRGTLCC